MFVEELAIKVYYIKFIVKYSFFSSTVARQDLGAVLLICEDLVFTI